MKAFAISDKYGGGWWTGSGWSDYDHQAWVGYSRSAVEMELKKIARESNLVEEVDDEEIGPKSPKSLRKSLRLKDAMNPPQQYNVFISYSRKDTATVLPIVKLLQAAEGSGIFLDVLDIAPGHKWRAVLDEAIDEAEVFFLFWSANSSVSVEVDKEVQQALTEGKRIVPILLDDTPMPPEISQFNFVDMRQAGVKSKAVIGVDLHRTLGDFGGPGFDGLPMRGAIEGMQRLRDAGHVLCIWTVGDTQGATEWADHFGVPYDYVNVSPIQPDTTSPKMRFDRMIDDKNVLFDGDWQGTVDGILADEELQQRSKSIRICKAADMDLSEELEIKSHLAEQEKMSAYDYRTVKWVVRVDGKEDGIVYLRRLPSGHLTPETSLKLQPGNVAYDILDNPKHGDMGGYTWQGELNPLFGKSKALSQVDDKWVILSADEGDAFEVYNLGNPIQPVARGTYGAGQVQWDQPVPPEIPRERVEELVTEKFALPVLDMVQLSKAAKPVLKNSSSGRLLKKKDDGSFTFVVSAENFDRDGDRVFQEGLDFRAFDAASAPAMLVHNTEKIPVGRWLPETRRITTIDDPVTGETVKATLMDFLPNPHTREGVETGKSVADNFLGAASVSFLPVAGQSEQNDHGGSDYYKAEVSEISLCPVPANSSATRKVAMLCKSLSSRSTPMKRYWKHKSRRQVCVLKGEFTEREMAEEFPGEAVTVSDEPPGNDDGEWEEMSKAKRKKDLGPGNTCPECGYHLNDPGDIGSDGSAECPNCDWKGVRKRKKDLRAKYWRHKTERRVRVLKSDGLEPEQFAEDVVEYAAEPPVDMSEWDEQEMAKGKLETVYGYGEWLDKRVPEILRQAGKSGLSVNELVRIVNRGGNAFGDTDAHDIQSTLNNLEVEDAGGGKFRLGAKALHKDAFTEREANDLPVSGQVDDEGVTETGNVSPQLTKGEQDTAVAMSDCVADKVASGMDQETAFAECGQKAKAFGVTAKTLARVKGTVLRKVSKAGPFKVGDKIHFTSGPYEDVQVTVVKPNDGRGNVVVTAGPGGEFRVRPHQMDEWTSNQGKSKDLDTASEPLGLSMLKKWHKAISDDVGTMHETEQGHAIEAAKKACEHFAKAALKAYGEELKADEFGEDFGTMPDRSIPDVIAAKARKLLDEGVTDEDTEATEMAANDLEATPEQAEKALKRLRSKKGKKDLDPGSRCPECGYHLNDPGDVSPQGEAECPNCGWKGVRKSKKGKKEVEGGQSTMYDPATMQEASETLDDLADSDEMPKRFKGTLGDVKDTMKTDPDAAEEVLNDLAGSDEMPKRFKGTLKHLLRALKGKGQRQVKRYWKHKTERKVLVVKGDFPMPEQQFAGDDVEELAEAPPMTSSLGEWEEKDMVPDAMIESYKGVPIGETESGTCRALGKEFPSIDEARKAIDDAGDVQLSEDDQEEFKGLLKALDSRLDSIDSGMYRQYGQQWRKH